MRLRVSHTTRYEFAEPVRHGLQRLRLTPKSTQGQTVLDWSMHFDGATPQVEYEDHNRNLTSLIAVDPGSTSMTVESRGTVITADSAGVVGPHTGHVPLWLFLDQSNLTRPGTRIRALMSGLYSPRDNVVSMLHRLSAKILAQVPYVSGETGVTTTAEEAAALGAGVCQDHAHIFIGAARALGVPARYVSGYLMMNDRIEQEAGHGWAEAHVEGLGWVGFDVSNGISPDERYVRVATGRDYREAAPVTGLRYGPGESTLEVRLAVEQQHAEQ